MTAALALPDPQAIAVAEVRDRVVPMAVAWRDQARAAGDVGAARDLADRLSAFSRYLRDRESRDMLLAEVRRTEVLIGELLGPAEAGRPTEETSQPRDVSSVPRQDRVRFRTLAEHSDVVESLLTADRPIVSRERILDAIKRGPVGSSLAKPPEGKFNVIVADPPWRYGNAATRANADGHYDGTLSVEQLCGLEPMPDGSKLPDQVEAWSPDDAHLYLWTTAGFLREAFDVMAAWGFTYKTFLAWVKPQIGMGNYFRVSSELVLFGIRGRLPIEDRSIRNWFEAKRGKHSAKPREFYDLVEQASPGPYLEMFARCDAGRFGQLAPTCQCAHHLRGWETWGNEA
jgi:N6-adenosine-specific RNA methylase IME4